MYNNRTKTTKLLTAEEKKLVQKYFVEATKSNGVKVFRTVSQVMQFFKDNHPHIAFRMNHHTVEGWKRKLMHPTVSNAKKRGCKAVYLTFFRFKNFMLFFDII